MKLNSGLTPVQDVVEEFELLRRSALLAKSLLTFVQAA